MSHNPFATDAVASATQSIQSSVRSGVPASAVYEGKITAAYLIKNNYDASKDDLAVHIELNNGYEYKIQKTVLKDNSPMAVNSKTGKTELLFTYQQIAHIVGAATDGKTLGDLFSSIEVKKIKLYDFESRSEVLTDVNMVSDLVGRTLIIGLQRKIANKRQQVDGEWIDLPERRESLEFGVAASSADRRTFNEMNQNVPVEEAKDVAAWEKRNAGKDWDAYKEVAPTTGGVPAGVPAAGASTGQVHDFGSS